MNAAFPVTVRRNCRFPYTITDGQVKRGVRRRRTAALETLVLKAGSPNRVTEDVLPCNTYKRMTPANCLSGTRRRWSGPHRPPTADVGANKRLNPARNDSTMDGCGVALE